MRTLPHGWSLAPLNELAKLTIGGDWGKEPNETDPRHRKVRCIRGTELRAWPTENGKTAATRIITITSLEKRALKPNDLIVEISGGGPDQPVGRAVRVTDTVLSAHNPFPVVCTNFFRRVSLLEPELAAYIEKFLFLDYVQGGTLSIQSGSNNLRNLNFNAFLQKQIPLPPYSEQRRIVAKLDSLRARSSRARQELDRIPKLIERYKQAILAKAFSGELTNKPLPNSSTPPSLKADCQIDAVGPTGSNIPRSWRWVRAEALCDWITKGTTPPNHAWSNEAQGVPYIKVYNLTFTGRLDFSVEPSYIVPDVHDTTLKRSAVRAGDVLMNIVGPPLGKVSIVPPDIPEANINQAIAFFRPKPPLANKYLAYWLLSAAYLNWTLGRSKATAGQRNLTLEICRDSPIPFTTISEQQEIVRRIDAAFAWLDKIAAEQVRATQLLPKLDQAILANAFRGELVPQDPNDEPASELLKRIKVERDEGATAKARKRGSK